MKHTLLLCLICLFFLPCSAQAEMPDVLSDYIPQRRVTRFEAPISVWMGGEGQLSGQSFVEDVLAELHRILPHVSIEQASSKSQANLRVYLTDSHEEWRNAIVSTVQGGMNWEEHGENIRGFTRIISAGDGHIRQSDVILHLDFQSSGGQKLWVIRHEFMHALGVTGHPRVTKNSVLNSHQPEEEKNSLFSDNDILVLQSLYRKDVTAGKRW